jgi:hypothetical protein
MDRDGLRLVNEIEPPEPALGKSSPRVARRRLIKGTVAVAGGVIAAGYVQPELKSFGSAVAHAVGSSTQWSDRYQDWPRLWKFPKWPWWP